MGKLRLRHVRECVQVHITTKMLKRDVDPVQPKPILLYKAASQSVLSNYILIIHILTPSSHSDVMKFGPQDIRKDIIVFSKVN